MLLKAVSLALVLAPLAQAHYIFNRLIVNGTSIGGEYAYTRKNSNSYNPAFTNDIVNSNNLRCNVGAMPSSSVGIYTVAAGSKLGFKLFNNEFIEHPGPGFVDMSLAPNGVATYDGSGDWFRVYATGLCGGSPGNDGSWCSWQKDRLEYTIHPQMPPGEYLVRVEHIGLHEGHVGKAQFYIECYQLKITGPGGANPGPLFKIPGIYKANDPGIAFNKWNNPTSYVMPGPKVWDGTSSFPPTGNPPPVATPTPPPQTSQPPVQTSNPPPAGTVPKYGQCGGQGYNGPTDCVSGTSCTASNQYYSQCL